MSDAQTTAAPADFSAAQSRALTVGVIGLVLCAIGAIFDSQQFFRSYLLGWLFWLGVAVGCLPLMLLHHQTGGAWGFVIRRALEAGTRTLVYFIPLGIPLVFGLRALFAWANPDVVAADHLLQHRAGYLNVPFFLVRTAIYLGLWMFVAWRINSWSLEQDRTGDVRLQRKMQLLSGPGIVIYFLSATFFSFDWVMSLDPHWYSTLYGALWVVGQGLSAFAFVIVVLFHRISEHKPISDVMKPDIYQDLGKLMLAFVMVWMYFSFSQFLIIWSGNLPEEITYYLDRSRGGWPLIAALLVFGGFVLPFCLLLSRNLKRNARGLALVAFVVFCMRFVDVIWAVVPNFHKDGVALHPLDLAAPVGIGGIFVWAFFAQLRTRPLLPLNDPYLAEALADGGH
jgi:hypothetical protein